MACYADPQTGFAVSFRLLCRALQQAGYDVRINDKAAALDNPAYPVGIVGSPSHRIFLFWHGISGYGLIRFGSSLVGSPSAHRPYPSSPTAVASGSAD